MFSEVFVSHSVHRGGGRPSFKGRPFPLEGDPPPSGTDIQWWPLQTSVRILLECILVLFFHNGKVVNQIYLSQDERHYVKLTTALGLLTLVLNLQSDRTYQMTTFPPVIMA